MIYFILQRGLKTAPGRATEATLVASGFFLNTRLARLRARGAHVYSSLRHDLA